MKSVRPKPLLPDADAKRLHLSPEEGFVLSRIDGNLSLEDLVDLTGIEPARVESIVGKLATEGVVTLETDDLPSGLLPESDDGTAPWPADDDGTAPWLDDAASSEQGPAQTAFRAASPSVLDALAFAAEPDPPPNPPVDQEEIPLLEPWLEAEGEGEDEGEGEGEGEDAPQHESKSSLPPIAVRGDGDEAAFEDAPTEEDAAEDAAPASQSDPEAGEEAAARVENERNYRKIYETEFRGLERDAREHMATIVHGPQLMALCFDSDPKVIAAVLANSGAGLDHARYIAFHHRNPAGLDMLGRRTEFVRDSFVRRRLLRNPATGESLVKRLVSPRRMMEIYKTCVDREIPDLTRTRVRGLLRAKFQHAPSEERAELVVHTEGRCLILLIGCTFDGRTTQILCGRTYVSTLFIQNLARFSACPPILLAHLSKQTPVRRQMHLRKMILSHPNCPGDVKRNF